MLHHPHVTTLFNLFNTENQPFRKVHRMIDLFESIIKTYTVVIISEYVKRNKLSDSAKELLAHGLRTPSLGIWQLFSRVLFEELNNEKHQWMLTDFKAAFDSFDKALQKDKTNAISLRNSYAHGATPSDEKCNLDIKKFEPFLNQLLLTKWLENTGIEEIDGMVFLVSENNSLCLHPILLYRREESPASFAFFNDLKDDKVGLLNYPLAKHYREKKFYSEFHEYLPLQNWKTKGNNEFYQRIEELTDTFKGRNVEREKLLHFVIQKNKGYFSVQGNPGVGKSALLAQFLKDLRTNEEAKKIKVISYFIRRGTPQAQVNHFLNYLVKCTDDIFPAGKEIHALDNTYWSLQNQLFEKWRLWGDHNKDNKLLFLIDGLDEGVNDHLVNFMPRENFENILIIYGSRPGGHHYIDEFWGTLPADHHTKLELKGLTREDIRAMLYEVANKYEIERESPWINTILERSQGNPLYLKLLCSAIENGSITLNDAHAIPNEIDDYYKAILQRYANDKDGDAIFASLFTFAASKDYLTIPHIGLINKLSDATLERVGSTLKEVLNENPLTKDVLDYQLFHESFREYLIKQNAVKVIEAGERLIEFCANWQSLEGTYEQHYPLENYALHLSESKKEVHHKELLALLNNEPYQVAQKRVLKQFNATKQLYQLSLIKAGELNKHDIQLEAALGLLDIKYEAANDATRIVLLIANGEIDLGLKRIESFAGNDKEGFKRKFILYMLCLMELSLLDSKVKSFRKTSIEKLLNHLDEQLPVDHSLINWNDFFPSYLVFLMATEWATLGLDYLVVYKRASDWEKEWIKEKGPYSDIQFEVLLACVESIGDVKRNIKGVLSISMELIKQDKLDEALVKPRKLIGKYNKCMLLKEISGKLFIQGKSNEALLVLNEAKEFINEISNVYLKCKALASFSSELKIQGRSVEADFMINEAKLFAYKLIDGENKSEIMIYISRELAKQGKIEESELILNEARSVVSEDSFKKVKKQITNAMIDLLGSPLEHLYSDDNYFTKMKSMVKLASELKIDETLICAKEIGEENLGKKLISRALAKQGNITKSIVYAREITDGKIKSEALIFISGKMEIEGNKLGADKLINEALGIAREITDRKIKGESLRIIAKKLISQKKLDFVAIALKENLLISANLELKENLIKDISRELACKGMLHESFILLDLIKSSYVKSKYILNNSIGIAKNGSAADALVCARSITDDYLRYKSLLNISSECAKADKIVELVECAKEITDFYWRSQAFKSISSELFKLGKEKETKQLIQEALLYADKITDEYSKCEAMNLISIEFAMQGDMEKALECSNRIIDKKEKSVAISFIAITLARTGATNKSLQYAKAISDAKEKSKALALISTELAKQKKYVLSAQTLKKSLFFARTIAKNDSFSGITYMKDLKTDLQKRCYALKDIFIELMAQNKIDDASLILQEVIECVTELRNEKNRIFEEFSNLFINKNMLDKALEVTHKMDVGYIKNRTLVNITSAFREINKFVETENIILVYIRTVCEILNEKEKNEVLSDLTIQLIKHKYWQLAEKASLEISEIAKMHSSWQDIAIEISKQEGWQNALLHVNKLQKEEARIYYLKGLVNNITIIESNSECLETVLPYLTNDTESIEKLMQNYALRELFFGDSDQNKIRRLNQSLNINWAMDIKKEFPGVVLSSRVYANIKEWLHDIYDEDIKDQIQLWARQVSKGKITEDQFNSNIRDLFSN